MSEAGSGRKRKQYYSTQGPSKKKQRQGVKRGGQAFLLTADSGREFRAARELIAVLEEFDTPPQPQPANAANATEQQSSSIDSQLQAEIEELKQQKDNSQDTRRFRPTNFEMRGVCIVQMNAPETSPQELLGRVFAGIAASKRAMTRHCVRVVPLDEILSASVSDILRRIPAVINKCLSPDHPPCKYAIRLKSRSSSSFDREDLIKQIADMVDSKHSVDLTNPDKVIIVELFKEFAGIGHAVDCHKLNNFNLRTLYDQFKSSSDAKSADSTAADAQASQNDTTPVTEAVSATNGASAQSSGTAASNSNSAATAEEQTSQTCPSAAAAAASTASNDTDATPAT